MKRLLIALAALAAVAAVATLITAEPAEDSRYAVDVVFDDARGLVPGQLVQVAGADVGTIKEVSVTPGFKARIHMDVDARFAPFRKDAKCTIRSKGLIAENYVQCDPGTPESGELTGRGGEDPTVPVERTTQPVSLVDLFEIWNAPTRQRTQILLSTLGVAAAGRGQDINEVLRRANPSLQLAQSAIGMLERQRTELAAGVDATAVVARAIARRPQDLRALLRHGSRVATETATHRDALGEGVRRLPPLLSEATPALQKLDATMAAGQPLLDQLELAAPDVNRITEDVPALAQAARPTLRRLAPVLREGASTAKRSAGLLGLVRDYSRNSLPSAQTAGVMFPALEESGFVGDLLGFSYNMAVATARHDDVGHILPAHVAASRCGLYARTPSDECVPEAERAAKKRTARKRSSRSARPPIPPSAPAVPPPPSADPTQALFDFLLR